MRPGALRIGDPSTAHADMPLALALISLYAYACTHVHALVRISVQDASAASAAPAKTSAGDLAELGKASRTFCSIIILWWCACVSIRNQRPPTSRPLEQSSRRLYADCTHAVLTFLIAHSDCGVGRWCFTLATLLAYTRLHASEMESHTLSGTSCKTLRKHAGLSATT